MEEIRRSGVTIVYVSHAAGSVAKMCDRVIVLEQGKKGFDGPTLDGIRYVKYDEDLPPELVGTAQAAMSSVDSELGADI
jgi:ABC-2 type transport system ATP-binding protein